MNTNSYIVLALIPLIFIVPVLLRRRIRSVFSKNWPWIILGIICLAFLIFVRDIPNAREGMHVVKEPKHYFSRHFYWESVDPLINKTWEEVYFAGKPVTYNDVFTDKEWTEFLNKISAAYSAAGHTFDESLALKGIVQAGQNEMVTHIAPADLCPLTAHLLAIAMMFPKFRRGMSASVGAWAILGGILTLTTAPFEAWAMDYSAMRVIFGDYVGAHVIQTLLGVMALIVAPRITWRDLIKSLGFIAAVVIYISFIYWMTNITRQTTGIADGDWTAGGEFNIVPSLFGIDTTTSGGVHLARFSGWALFILFEFAILGVALGSQVLDRMYNKKVPQGPIYRHFEKQFVAFQQGFKHKVKEPTVAHSKRLVSKVAHIHHNLWKSDKNL